MSPFKPACGLHVAYSPHSIQGCILSWNLWLTICQWTGPTYDTRRGTWFYAEGGALRPCEEALAIQIEEGYLKEKPFRGVVDSASGGDASMSKTLDKRSSKDDVFDGAKDLENRAKAPPAPVSQPKSHRLFGPFMDTVVTYQDANVAWLSTDKLISRVSSTVYQTFGGGGHLAGTKIIRGYTESSKQTEVTETDPMSRTPTKGTPPQSGASTPRSDERRQRALNRRSASPNTRAETDLSKSLPSETEMEIEAIRLRDERDIRTDYYERDDENQGREITHLILVTHGRHTLPRSCPASHLVITCSPGMAYWLMSEDWWHTRIITDTMFRVCTSLLVQRYESSRGT